MKILEDLDNPEQIDIEAEVSNDIEFMNPEDITPDEYSDYVKEFIMRNYDDALVVETIESVASEYIDEQEAKDLGYESSSDAYFDTDSVVIERDIYEGMIEDAEEALHIKLDEDDFEEVCYWCFAYFSTYEEDEITGEKEKDPEAVIDLDADLAEGLDEETLNEIKMKKVVRSGKIIRKPLHRPGYTVKNGKYVKMSSSDRKRRSIIAKRAAKKAKAARKRGLIKRKRSMRKHTW